MKKRTKQKKKYTFKRFIATVLIAVFVIISIPVLINLYVIGYSSKYILSPDEYSQKEVDCVLVLGARVWDDSPSPLLQERLTKGMEIYNSGCAQKLLMSGDHGRKDYDEVNAMKSFAIENNISSEDVFMDHAGFSTYESMYRARDVFKVESLIITTQEYHLYRAIYNARKLGLEAYGVKADGMYDFDRSVQSYNNTREALARCKDFVWCIFNPEPTYLGEEIPINANGNLTNDKTEV